jgi:hypothetical protein
VYYTPEAWTQQQYLSLVTFDDYQTSVRCAVEEPDALLVRYNEYITIKLMTREIIVRYNNNQYTDDPNSSSG